VRRVLLAHLDGEPFDLSRHFVRQLAVRLVELLAQIPEARRLRGVLLGHLAGETAQLALGLAAELTVGLPELLPQTLNRFRLGRVSAGQLLAQTVDLPLEASQIAHKRFEALLIVAHLGAKDNIANAIDRFALDCTF